MKEYGSSYGAKMVLQDMAEVLEGKNPVRLDGVENMPHNFYNVQSVKSKLAPISPIHTLPAWKIAQTSGT